MADFKGTILTLKGRNLLAKAQTGVTLTFTKIKLGDALWSTNTDPTQLTDLVSPKLNLPIQEIRVVGDGTVRLRFVLTNTGLSQGFFMREIGIYAQDPDLGEILYAVAYAGDRADFIPSDGVTKVENVVDIYTVIANAQNVTAVISDTVVLATKRDIDELAQSLNNTASNLSNQISTVKPEAGSTAPSLVYQGKLWVDANDFLQYFDGLNWKNVKTSFADTVDGFHASLTPAPNVIVPLNASGILDLSATYVKSDVYTIRRINGNSLTSDYPLAVGEEAIYTFSTSSPPIYVPLRIATDPYGVYLILIFDYIINQPSSYLGHYFLYANNTTYSDAFKVTFIIFSEGSTSLEFVTYSSSSFFFDWFPGGICSAIVNVYNRVAIFESSTNIATNGLFPGSRRIGTTRWLDKSTAWTSLGTMQCNSTGGVILVRRLA